MASLPQLTDALLTLENGVAVLTLNRHDLRTELKDFLDICACFQGMSHNEPEHLDAVNRMLEAMARK